MFILNFIHYDNHETMKTTMWKVFDYTDTDSPMLYLQLNFHKMDQAKEMFEKLALLVTTPDCYDEFFNKMNFMHGKKQSRK